MDLHLLPRHCQIYSHQLLPWQVLPPGLLPTRTMGNFTTKWGNELFVVSSHHKSMIRHQELDNVV